jgi:hypothetical protein
VAQGGLHFRLREKGDRCRENFNESRGERKESFGSEFVRGYVSALSTLVLPERREEEKEVDLGRVDAVQVDVVTRHVGRPHGSEVGVRQTLDERVESDLVDERLGDRELEDSPGARLELVQTVRLFELDLEHVKRRRELVRQERSRDRAVLDEESGFPVSSRTHRRRRGARTHSSLVLLPDALELLLSVLGNLLLDLKGPIRCGQFEEDARGRLEKLYLRP